MAHIAIEGMDGVGKTTTCKLLAERLGYKFIEKNLRFLFDDNDSFDNYFRIRDKVKKAKAKYEKMVFFCEKYKMPYMVVDTSNLTPDQTVELIMKRIEGRA